jgi:hypothetical protein
MKKITIGVGLALAIALAGCGGEAKKEEAAKAPDAAAAPAGGAGGAATPDEANGATITGKVAFDGAKPTPKTLDVSANAVCVRAHTSSPLKSEEVVVNDNNTVKNAFVWVKSGLPDKQWQVPSTPVTLDQAGCAYKPHVIAVQTGQNIEIKNSDPTNHNIHPQPATNQEWNQSQPPGADAMVKSFPRQEIMMPVKCNVHSWMRSYINVVGHPFYAVTGDDGSFTIKGLPPGTYTIEVRHEKLPTQEQQVTVGAKESKTLDFTLKG